METWSLVEGHWLNGEHPGATARWFNVVGADSPELDELAARFGLHHLSVEDCRSTAYHAAKIDEFDNHLFIVFHSPPDALDESPPTEEIDVFLGRDFLITYEDRPLFAVANLLAALEDGRHCRPGPDGLLYEIIDRAVDTGLPLVNRIGERIEQLQQQVLDESTPDASRSVLLVRAYVGRLRRTIAPQLAVINRLSRGEFGFVDPANQVYFRDVYDHLVRLDFALEGVREDAEVALSTHLSVLNNRMNEVMKVLSVVSALALPAVVIAGIFGTNFDSVPGLHSNWGFVAMVISMAGLASGMAWVFKRRHWF